MTTNDKDEKITLVSLPGGVWPNAKLVRRTPSIVPEFMDRANDFIDAEDKLRALIVSRRSELEQAESSSKKPSGEKMQKKAKMTAHKLEHANKRQRAHVG